MTQDPTPHQTDLDSVIHLDEVVTPPTNVTAETKGNGNGKGSGKTKVVVEGGGARKSARSAHAPGLKMERRFTTPGVDVYGTVEWERRDAVITNERGEKVFEQTGVEIPKTWTQLATNVVVSKYFRGHIGTPSRETSVRQLIHRVADTMANWGRAGDYFATEEDAQTFQDELTHILLHQKAAFNSPVWFNVGLPDQPTPQVSACFINGVEDTMESILTLAKTEGMLFKYGSGTGTNLSSIRGSHEPLNGGGTASGPISFMRGFDQFAGAIKSGGKCFKKGTLVATPDGWLPIETLQIGDMVLTHKGPRPVADFIPNGWKQCYKVRTQQGYELEVTQGHKFAYWNALEGRFDVKPIEDFAIGEALYLLLEASEGGTSIPLVVPEANDPPHATTTTAMQFPTELNDELGYVLGLMYGDAELRTQYPYRVRVAFCKDQAGQISAERFRQYCCHLFGEEPLLLEDASGHQQIGFTHKRLVEFLTANGIAKGKAGTLGFPKMLFQARPEVRAAFIAGVMDADGSYQRRGGWSIACIDRSFLVELQRLLLTLGIPSKIGLSRDARGTWRRLYKLQIVGSLFITQLMKHTTPYSAKAAVNYVPSNGADKGWGYRPSLYEELISRIERRGGYRLIERKIGLNETTGYRALTSLMEHPHTSVANYAAELSRCVQVTLESVMPTEIAETYDIEVAGVHLLCANGLYASNTRRAAKMVILDIDHPDIVDFITSKEKEEKKAWALIDAGYSGMFNVPGGAYDSVSFQNANHSVRVTDAFMQAVEKDADWSTRHVLSKEPATLYKARELMQMIGQSAWVCGDPGMQYDTTINRWHTCKNTDRIYASNPCSEYMFLNDSACNLASLNLIKFRRADGEFDVESFQHACRVLITAQEIIVDNASYPTPRIAENSHDYRPLGLGYANLGALLMARGLAYDSDAGRAYAGAITAIMTGEAYHQSSLIARDHGWPFPGYQKNREPFLEVMRMHRQAVERIPAATLPDDMMAAARACWDNAIAQGGQHGYRNAQSTVLAPTGTIGFLMDCDTTGIEPDIAIVKYKNLVGGGVMKIVNNTVPEALQKLGYTPAQVSAILAYIDQHDTIEGAPELKPEHLPIFDCAFKPGNGVRSIHYLGHVKMMAACQPFISGAISKCVTGDTLLCTDQGILPIAQFYAGEKPGNFRACEITLGSVSSPQRADLFYYGGVRPTVRLMLADGRTLEGTPNHRIKVANAQGYDWKRLDEITSEDHVAVRLGADLWATENAPIAFQASERSACQQPVRIPERMSPALGRLLGYYVANGSMTVTNGTVRIPSNRPNVLRRSQALLGELFGLEGRIVEDGRNGVQHLVVASKTLVELLTYLGCGGNSAQKQIPWSVLQSRREVVQEFVAGLWLGGTVRQDDTVALCLNSETLIHQLQVVLNNFGLRAQIRQYDKKYAKRFHELGLHGDDACRFASLFQLDDLPQLQRLQEIRERTKKTTADPSDVVPCYRARIQQVLSDAQDIQDTQTWHLAFDPCTRHLPWQTVHAIYARYRLTELAEIMDNNIHFVAVRDITESMKAVYDFQVPENHAFLGNSIVNHNTVNMPHEATPEEIIGTYMEGWKLGLKAIAIYRDGSKRTQPLMTRKADEEPKAAEAGKEEVKKEETGPAEIASVEARAPVPIPAVMPTARAMRRKLPDERRSITHKFSIAGHEGYITVGTYPDGTAGEIFLTMSKEGSTISGLMDSFATAISLALQYGVPLQTLVDKFAHTRFEPSGITNNPDIRFAKSIMDYIFRWLGTKFLTHVPAGDGPSLSNGPPDDSLSATEAAAPSLQSAAPKSLLPQARPLTLTEQERETFQNQADAPICTECGSLMVRNGACFKCLNCGSVFGCS